MVEFAFLEVYAWKMAFLFPFPFDAQPASFLRIQRELEGPFSSFSSSFLEPAMEARTQDCFQL